MVFTGLDGTSLKGTVRLDLQSRQGKCRSGRAAFACFARSRVLPCPLAETFGTIHFGGRPCCPACLGINALRRSLSFLLGGSSMTRWSREDMGFFWFLCQVSHLEQLLPNRLCFQQGWIRAARNMSESSGSFVFLVSKTIQNIPKLKHVTDMCNSEPRNSTQFSYCQMYLFCFLLSLLQGPCNGGLKPR